MHISPRTVEYLRTLGHDTVRVGEVLEHTATDEAIIAEAIRDARVIVSQDLDFSAIIATSGIARPSVLSLRLSSSRFELVNARLFAVLPRVEADLLAGALVSVEDRRVRTRKLPVPRASVVGASKMVGASTVLGHADRWERGAPGLLGDLPDNPRSLLGVRR